MASGIKFNGFMLIITHKLYITCMFHGSHSQCNFGVAFPEATVLPLRTEKEYRKQLCPESFPVFEAPKMWVINICQYIYVKEVQTQRFILWISGCE